MLAFSPLLYQLKVTPTHTSRRTWASPRGAFLRDVDWDLDLLDHMVPGIKSPGAKYGERDYEELSEGKGRMCGDLSGMDWTR